MPFVMSLCLAPWAGQPDGSTLCYQKPTHWERLWCWERMKTKGEEGSRGWDGWRASPTQGTWIWANSRRQWRIGKCETHIQSTLWLTQSSPCIFLCSLQYSSVTQSCLTPWTAACQASLSITNSQSPRKPMSIELVMPSNHLILCHPLLLLPSIFPSIRVFWNESALHIRWPKYWSFSFNISPSNEHPGLISFRMNWLDLLAV